MSVSHQSRRFRRHAEKLDRGEVNYIVAIELNSDLSPKDEELFKEVFLRGNPSFTSFWPHDRDCRILACLFMAEILENP